MIKNTLRTLPTLLLLAFSGVASASAFQLGEQNASGLGTAYAGSAAIADNASTVFFNPAGMTQLKGVHISGGLVGIGSQIRFRGLNGSSGGDAGGWHGVPNAYLSWQLTPALTAGVGLSSPFGLATEYKAAWVGQQEGIKSELTTLNLNPSVAYKVNDKVSLGLGLNYQKVDGELTSTGIVLKGDDASYGWNAGALFTLSPAMRVGVSYRSAIGHTLKGHVNAVVPVKADLDLPGTFILSVWQQVSDRWEAMGDLSYTRWNSLDRLVVVNRNTGMQFGNAEVYNYDNSWRIAWGAAYRSNDVTKLKFGLAYDRTPVNSRDRSVRVPDNDRLWLSLGGQWKLGRASVVDLGYSYLYMKDPKIAQGNAIGKYDNSAHIVGVQYSVGY
ncbi:OmpP1/FadL family transporter [Azonexus sp.]|jgi:long-chain fatty acid transport protein|uniref:OmpP1/FadL family transporter n=1 Tax=Azonexus sp. TaxID=1872668 RepID=UPI0027B99D14|nr:outer membrane protein transport protein [Azonexus sp.]